MLESMRAHADMLLAVAERGAAMDALLEWALAQPSELQSRFDHTDHTRSPLRDYSRTYRIKIPPNPGVYTVTVEVRDPGSGRAARSQPAEFRVAGQ